MLAAGHQICMAVFRLREASLSPGDSPLDFFACPADFIIRPLDKFRKRQLHMFRYPVHFNDALVAHFFEKRQEGVFMEP